MNQDRGEVQSQITCFYYRDLEQASRFYEDTMGFELVQILEGWYRIYRTSRYAYLAIVDEERGFYKAQERNAVLLVFAVTDVSWWYDYLKAKGAKLTSEIEEMEEIRARCFFVEDPGGYAIEIEQFLEPDASPMLR